MQPLVVFMELSVHLSIAILLKRNSLIAFIIHW